ncbi:MAG: hypothetical protein H0U87_07600, partial [Acidobacteria bacterium]|nr:hypothetical protein [Acidobacteriota bacterium]
FQTISAGRVGGVEVVGRQRRGFKRAYGRRRQIDARDGRHSDQFLSKPSRFQRRVNQAWSNQMRDEGIWRDPADPNTHYRINNNVLPPDGNTGRLEPVPVGDLHL